MDGEIALVRDRWIGRLLRIGVILSSLFLLTGLTIALTSDDGAPSKSEAIGANVVVHHVSPESMLSGLKSGEARAFIQLGLLLLILTPTARVALTAFFFYRERDFLFLVLAGAVFVILALGLAGFGAF